MYILYDNEISNTTRDENNYTRKAARNCLIALGVFLFIWTTKTWEHYRSSLAWLIAGLVLILFSYLIRRGGRLDPDKWLGRR
jgi:EamA domain-containing membrane protein RarD